MDSLIKFDIHYWYCLNFSFNFQANGCNICHDLLIMSINFSDIAVLNIKGSDYRRIINVISKNEVLNLMQNGYLSKNNGTL